MLCYFMILGVMLLGFWMLTLIIEVNNFCECSWLHNLFLLLLKFIIPYGFKNCVQSLLGLVGFENYIILSILLLGFNLRMRGKRGYFFLIKFASCTPLDPFCGSNFPLASWSGASFSVSWSGCLFLVFNSRSRFHL